MEFWNSFSGMLVVEFTSASPESALDDIALSEIHLSHVIQKDQLSYQALIRRRDYRKIGSILQKRGDRLRVVRKRGLYWDLKAAIHRPALLAVFFFLLFASLFLPSRVFFVMVEGNTEIPDRLILSAAEDCGICFAASRKHIRSEKVKNALLSEVPQLQWAGINTYGCTAVISVRERVDVEQPAEANIVSNLIAERDGYILSATITNGTSHIHPGETVSKGQLLISGYTDCGLHIRASRAEGEVIAQTNRSIKAVTPSKYASPMEIKKTKYRISLIIGKKRINLWKSSRISDVGCGRMYEEYYLSLPGGFQLPAAIAIDQYRHFKTQEVCISEDNAQLQLQEFSEKYVRSQMIAGQITGKKQILSSSDGLYKLESSYSCTETIGQEQREQIGVINGKRN